MFPRRSSAVLGFLYPGSPTSMPFDAISWGPSNYLVVLGFRGPNESPSSVNFVWIIGRIVLSSWHNAAAPGLAESRERHCLRVHSSNSTLITLAMYARRESAPLPSRRHTVHAILSSGDGSRETQIPSALKRVL